MIIITQIIAAVVVGACYYMLAVAMTVYDGLLSMILQPIIGVLVSLVAVFFLLILGLPIRLNRIVNKWWKAHWWLSFIIGTAAFVMMVISWLPMFRVPVMDSEMNMMVESFHPVLAITGWLLTLFAVLHFYPPLPRLKYLMK